MTSERQPSRCRTITDADADYLRDESRWVGRASSIAFPETEAEVRAVLAECLARGEPVTCQGSRTGITGGAAPWGGCVLNLSRMNRVVGLGVNPATGHFTVRVQPGVLLRDLRERLRSRSFGLKDADPHVLADFQAGPGWEFPPDPTETTASLGGMIACNSSGARSYRYGAVRQYVLALRVLLADGRVLIVRRGAQRAQGRRFELFAENNSQINGHLPSYAMPAVKNAAGYYARDDMDLVDLFVGSEGTLGVVTEAELELSPVPALQWGVMMFLPRETMVPESVVALRNMSVRWSAIEYFDARSLEFLQAIRSRVGALQTLPALKREWQAAVYVEWDAENEKAAMAAMEELNEHICALGISEEATWTAVDEMAMARLREFRHALPEQVNARIDVLRKHELGLTKLGTDMAVPDERLGDALTLYRQGIQEYGLEAVQFGHIGDNHIHVNILPRTVEERDRGKRLYLEWARQVITWGGTISAEHGVGKLKVDLLREMYGAQGIREMLKVKRAFDPELRLGPGTLFGVR